MRTASPHSPATRGRRTATITAVLLCGLLTAASPYAEELQALDGLLEPDMTVDLASPVPGVIMSITVERGDTVAKDQLLIQLRDDVQRAQVALAKVRASLHGEVSAREAALQLADRRHRRTRQLYAKRVIPLDDLDAAEATAQVAAQDLGAAREQRKLAVQELALAQEELAQRQILSPIDGVVIERLLAPGAHADELPIVRIARIDPLRVEVVVPVEYYGAISQGMQAEIEPELSIAERYTATVAHIDRVVDAASGTFVVQMSLPNPGGKLPSGLKCKVIFPGGLAQAYPRKTPDASGEAPLAYTSPH